MMIKYEIDTVYRLHLSDLYYEKKPGSFDYHLRYVENGHIVFKPFHSYILPIWEESDQPIKKMNRITELYQKFSKSAILLYYTVNNLFKWSIEYINTESVWTYYISYPVVNIMVNSLEFYEQ